MEKCPLLSLSTENKTPKHHVWELGYINNCIKNIKNKVRSNAAYYISVRKWQNNILWWGQWILNILCSLFKRMKSLHTCFLFNATKLLDIAEFWRLAVTYRRHPPFLKRNLQFPDRHQMHLYQWNATCECVWQIPDKIHVRRVSWSLNTLSCFRFSHVLHKSSRMKSNCMKLYHDHTLK